jgi:Skp family chaperone for outer membrane proteins
MIRWNIIAACAALVAGAAFVTGTSLPPRPTNKPAQPEENKAMVLGQKTGYFNMAAVMRDFNLAKEEVKHLNDQRTELSVPLIAWRDKYLKIQQFIQEEKNPEHKEELAKEQLNLARQIEDKDREINKILNDRATLIISGLYDKIYAVTRAMARENNLVAVIAYPDAVTEQERENPMIKELKLKPPACQPFYLDPSVEYSGEIIKRLNDKFAVNGGK